MRKTILLLFSYPVCFNKDCRAVNTTMTGFCAHRAGPPCAGAYLSAVTSLFTKERGPLSLGLLCALPPWGQTWPWVRPPVVAPSQLSWERHPCPLPGQRLSHVFLGPSTWTVLASSPARRHCLFQSTCAHGCDMDSGGSRARYASQLSVSQLASFSTLLPWAGAGPGELLPWGCLREGLHPGKTQWPSRGRVGGGHVPAWLLRGSHENPRASGRWA